MKLMLVVALLVSGCGSEDTTAEAQPSNCIEGTTISCVCTNGMNGAQVCQSDGTYNECICSSPEDAAVEAIVEDSALEPDVLQDTLEEVAIDVAVDVIEETTIEEATIEDAAQDTIEEVTIDVIEEPEEDVFVEVGIDSAIDAAEDIIEAQADVVEKCEPGVIECSGKVVRFCNLHGEWQDKETCEFICNDGECSGECEPGAAQCVGLEIQLCNASGKLEHFEYCAMACDDSGEVPECMGNFCCSEGNIHCKCNTQLVGCNSNEISKCAPEFDCCMKATTFDIGACDCIHSNLLGTETCQEYINNENLDGLFNWIEVDSCPSY